ncbi:QsdR family transcriptional regulator [Streptomyces sp. TLI_171]|uniref:QsdR family transcriptional regulator n=1 Tax=Streptomyces sp. TLI_171 TaxID=1938859 RepID=UPI00117D8DC5|nr:QsdR family transcriptional regulator [Streptomyces sp. TLI_171]
MAESEHPDPPDGPGKPTRDAALRLAREWFLRAERIDMRELATALRVGRTTLYRWFGDRDGLIGEVLARLADQTWNQLVADDHGTGAERGLDAIRRFMHVTAAFPPLRTFAAAEPAAALRVLMADGRAVSQALRTGFTRALAADGTAPSAEQIEIMVQLATALEWAPIVIGEEPAIDRAVALMRHLLDATA